MYKLARDWTLAMLKTPGEPHPPTGDPSSLKVFNAGRNYYRLRIFRWAVVELLALGGIIFWTAFLFEVERTASIQAEERAQQAAGTGTTGAEKTPRVAGDDAGARARFEIWKDRLSDNVRAAATEPRAAKDGKPSGKGRSYKGWAGFKQSFVEIALLLPAGAFVMIWGVKLFGLLVYLVQLPVTYAIVRLDYEMRWYMVTDRSLRLRQGVWKISEATMSFANIQQVVVSQGPLQRLLGLADVKVTSAGGGGGGGHHNQPGSEMHSGLFHCVTNATEIRDLIVERLRRFREAGLGDPDDKTLPSIQAAGVAPANAVSQSALLAAREFAAELRSLKSELIARGKSRA